MAAPANVPVSQGFARLFEIEAFSDCKVICGPYHFNLHKAVLSGHSDFFATAFKSGTFKEGETGVIELKAKTGDNDQENDGCDDPEIVKLMIEYFYHFDYLRKLPPDASSAAPKTYLIEHAKVFSMALKYQADGLCKLATQKFQQSAKLHWNHEDFARAMRIVQRSTSSGISQFWEATSDIVHANFKALSKKEEINEIIREVAGLSYSLLQHSRKDMEFYCSHTKTIVVAGELTCRSCGNRCGYCKTCYSQPNSMIQCVNCGTEFFIA